MKKSIQLFLALTPGGATWLKLYLPEGSQPDTYYKYGRTPDDETDHKIPDYNGISEP